MVMEPLCNKSLCVENEKVVTDAVLFKDTRSLSDIAMLTPCTWPCSIARLVAPTLMSSAEVLILRPEVLAVISLPVVNSPLANTSLCGPPAGKVPPPVVQTMLKVRLTIAQDTVTSLDPEADSSVAAGSALSEK